jgi:hypothetical protein
MVKIIFKKFLVRLSANFGIFNHYNGVTKSSKDLSSSFALDIKPCDVTNSQDKSIVVKKNYEQLMEENENSNRVTISNNSSNLNKEEEN